MIVARPYRVSEKLLAAFASVITCLLVTLCCAAPALADPQNGLVKSGDDLYFYKNGVVVQDKLVKVGGACYYFDETGSAVKGTSVEVNGKYLIFGNNGKLLAPKKNSFKKLAHGIFYVNKKGHPAKTGFFIKSGKLYYVSKAGKCKASGRRDGIIFTKNGYAKQDWATNLKIFVMQHIDSLTKPDWSRSKKLARCWQWCLRYGHYSVPSALDGKNLEMASWPQRQAWNSMSTGGVECFGGVCMLAMYAHELGYTPMVHAVKYYHADCYIEGKLYSWSRRPSMAGTNGFKYKVLNYRDTSPQGIGASSSDEGAKGKFTGWKKSKGKYRYYKKGKLQKGKWLKIKGKRYYVNKKGYAVTGAKKIKGVWYIFGAKRGVLLKGAGTRVVKVNGVKYRVAKSGKAKPGKDESTGKVYLENGALASGACLVNGRFVGCDESGVEDEAFTANLQTAYNDAAAETERNLAGQGSDDTCMQAFIALLGSPANESRVSTCRLDFEGGQDITRTYEHIVLLTYCAEKGPELLDRVTSIL